MVKEVSICDGQLIVVVPKRYCVYEKEVPEAAKTHSKINWIGNFGIIDLGDPKDLKNPKIPNNFKPKIKGKNEKVIPYKIIVPDKPGKTLHFWDVSLATPAAKPVPKQGPDQKKQGYKKGELDLGDPAIGWDL